MFIKTTQYAAFQEKLQEINTRLKRHGFELIVPEVIKHDDSYGSVQYEIHIDGYFPELSGWSVVAKLEFVGDEVLKYTFQDIPFEFEPNAYRCDHCNVGHYRRYAFILQHIDGDQIQVGHSCMGKLLGKQTKYLVSDEVQDFIGGRVRYENYGLDLFEYLYAVCYCIDTMGWVSRKGESRFKRSTATEADHLRLETIETDYIPSVDPKAAIEWLLAQQSGSEYITNLQSIIQHSLDVGGSLEPKFKSFAASLIYSYQRSLKPKKVAVKRSEAPLGRLEIEGVVVSLKTKHNGYGSVVKILVEHADGWRVYSTAPSDLLSEGVEKDDIVRFTATLGTTNDPYFVVAKRPSKASILRKGN